MWERVARDAAADAGGRVSGALGELEGIDVVYSQSWQYDDAVQRLSDRLGASPARRRYSGIGGSVPHVLAVEAAACDPGRRPRLLTARRRGGAWPPSAA